jgi:hypothetical protein
MATTGELLVQMSTLSTGTALDHFTNISFGGGGGLGGDDSTNYMEEALAHLLFMNEDLPLIGDQGGLLGSIIAGNFYIGLFTGDPGEAGDLLQEATYDGYTRVPIVRGAAGWEYKDEEAKNIPPITWQPAVSGVTLITYFGILDSLEDGNLLWRRELDNHVTINPGDSVTFDYNLLAVKIY